MHHVGAGGQRRAQRPRQRGVAVLVRRGIMHRPDQPAAARLERIELREEHGDGLPGRVTRERRRHRVLLVQMEHHRPGRGGLQRVRHAPRPVHHPRSERAREQILIRNGTAIVGKEQPRASAACRRIPRRKRGTLVPREHRCIDHPPSIAGRGFPRINARPAAASPASCPCRRQRQRHPAQAVLALDQHQHGLAVLLAHAYRPASARRQACPPRSCCTSTITSPGFRPRSAAALFGATSVITTPFWSAPS